MTLLVDMGNSRIKWASTPAIVSPLQDHGELAYPPCSDEFTAALIVAWSAMSSPARVVTANVAGVARASDVSRVARTLWDIEPEAMVPTAFGWGVANTYAEPRALGADRWAVLVAARRRLDGFGCVIDCGTAVTVDALSGEGRYLGGIILPGLDLMRRALSDNTDEIQYAKVAGGLRFAFNTADAVAAGALFAVVGAIDRALDETARVQGQSPQCIVTGGDAKIVIEMLKHRCELQSDLVLQGLAIMANENP